MVKDLRKQASEIYKEEIQARSLPTSESLSSKRVFLLSLGIAAAALIVFAIVGSVKSRPDPITTATTPPPLVIETPPAELLKPEEPAPLQSQPVPSLPAAEVAPSQPIPATPAAEPPKSARPDSEPPVRPPEAKRVPAPAATDRPASPSKPALRRDTGSEAAPVKATRAAAPSRAAAETTVSQPPVTPAVDPAETERQGLAREIVVQQKPSLAQLLTSAKHSEWHAELEKELVYRVSFAIPEPSGGEPLLYVWKVDIASKQVTPLSYHARRLP